MTTPSELEEAKKLLLANGYRVSDRPEEWRSLSCVVTLKVRGTSLTEKQFVRAINEVLTFRIPDVKSAIILFNAPIAAIGKLETKMFSRVKGGAKRQGVEIES